MILEFSITNFRSIREKQTFSMHASSARSKGDNIFEHQLANGETVNLVKAAVIYGANASGKSNVIYGLWELRKLLVTADNIKFDEPLTSYKPFLFDLLSSKQNTTFEILFIHKDEKYKYSIIFNQEEIVFEKLSGFPRKKERDLFTRTNENTTTDINIHVGKLGKELNSKQFSIHKKVPFFSFFEKASNYNNIVSPVFSYFKQLEIHNVTDLMKVRQISDNVKDLLQVDDNQWLQIRLEKLIKACDTQIENIIIDKDSKAREIEYQENEKRIKVTRNEVIFSNHKIYDSTNETKDVYSLPLKEESTGTNRLFALGGLVLISLKKGTVLFFDELDSSLHPFISRFLVKLFLNPISNPKNAQLIFTTHEPSILDKELLRADQIWFTEKTPEGATELFSAQDFDGVREDVPFDKWYMAGKFGAVPHISTIEYIFGNGEETND